MPDAGVGGPDISRLRDRWDDPFDQILRDVHRNRLAVAVVEVPVEADIHGGALSVEFWLQQLAQRERIVV